MIAVDTNVIVRYLARDEPKQARVAREIIEHQQVFVPQTVLLETEWVLRSLYRAPRETVIDRIRAFVSLPHVMVENDSSFARAIRYAEAGMDLADAMHLANCDQALEFVTFDKALAKTAATLTVTAVRLV